MTAKKEIYVKGAPSIPCHVEHPPFHDYKFWEKLSSTRVIARLAIAIALGGAGALIRLPGVGCELDFNSASFAASFWGLEEGIIVGPIAIFMSDMFSGFTLWLPSQLATYLGLGPIAAAGCGFAYRRFPRPWAPILAIVMVTISIGAPCLAGIGFVWGPAIFAWSPWQQIAGFLNVAPAVIAIEAMRKAGIYAPAPWEY